MGDRVNVVNNEASHRWEAQVDGEVVGYSEYIPSDGRVTFTHTVVEPEHEGKGIGSRLAQAALDNAVERGIRVVPRCPFIRAYIRRNPTYAKSVDWNP